MKKLFLPIIGLCFMAACAKYEVQYEGAYNDAQNTTGASPKVEYQIAYVESGKLFIIDPTLKYIKSFPTLPTNISLVSINPAHDKIAYKTASGNITIIDSTGQQLSSIPSTSGVTSFDWHENNQTLYYVDGLTLKLNGPSVPAAITDFTTSSFPSNATNKQIIGAILRKDGSVLYLKEYYTVGPLVRSMVLDNITGADKSGSIPYISGTITWLRGSLMGENVYYGSISTARNEMYRYRFSTFQTEILSGSLFAAYAPDGENYVSVTATLIRVNASNSFSKSINGTKVTSIDW